MKRLHCTLLLLACAISSSSVFAAAAGFYVAEYPINDHYALGIRIDAKGVITEIGMIEKVSEKEWQTTHQSITGAKEAFTINWDQKKGSRVLQMKTDVKIIVGADIRVSFNSDTSARDKKEVPARQGTEEEAKLKLKPVNK